MRGLFDDLEPEQKEKALAYRGEENHGDPEFRHPTTYVRTAADQFIGGKPVVYSGFDGKLYVATFFDGERNKLGIPQLQISDAQGKIVKDIIFSECNARTFFWNLDCEGE